MIVAKLVQQSCHRRGNVIRSNNTGREYFYKFSREKSAQRKMLHVPSRRVERGHSISLNLVTKPCVGRTSGGFATAGQRGHANVASNCDFAHA